MEKKEKRIKMVVDLRVKLVSEITKEIGHLLSPDGIKAVTEAVDRTLKEEFGEAAVFYTVEE